MLTANTPLLARLAENHIQMLIAHNQLAEAHTMLISQLVGQFENDPNEPTGANKPKPFAPDVKPQPITPSITEPNEQIKPEFVVEVPTTAEDKPAPVTVEKKGEAPKTETKPKSVKPIDFNALRSEASILITQLVKWGYRNEALDILSSFNAKKLADVTDDNLVQFIEKVENVLADDKLEGSDG